MKRHLLLGTSLDSGLGDLASLVRLVDGLDDTDSDAVKKVSIESMIEEEDVTYV